MSFSWSLQKSAKLPVDATDIKAFFLHQAGLEQLIKLLPEGMNTGLDPSHLLSFQFSEFLLVHHDVVLDKVLRLLIVLHNHSNYVVVSGGSFVGEVGAHAKGSVLSGLVKSRPHHFHLL